MTTPEQPPYEPVRTQPAGAPLGSAPVTGPTVRKGPGWGAYLVTIVALVVVAAVLSFVLQNTQRVDIKFLGWTRHGIKTAVALGAAAIAGLIAGLFLGLIPWMSARRKLRALRRGSTI